MLYTTEDPIVKARLVEAMETILNKASVSLSYPVVMVTPSLSLYQEPSKSKKVQHSNAKNAVLFEAINLIVHMDRLVLYSSSCTTHSLPFLPLVSLIFKSRLLIFLEDISHTKRPTWDSYLSKDCVISHLLSSHVKQWGSTRTLSSIHWRWGKGERERRILLTILTCTYMCLPSC